jgi:hypothetical protein
MQIIDDTLFSSAALTPISPADKALLQTTVEHFRPGSKNYEDSWGYVIQATRYGGFRLYDSAARALIFFGRKSPIDPSLVVPLFFAESSYLAATVKQVQHALKAPQTILKNVTPADIPALLPYGFREYKDGERWSDAAPFDDQTYPQQIVHLALLDDPKGRKYHQLKRQLNKKPLVTLRPYRETDKAAVLEVFALKDSNTKTIPDKETGMYYASHVVYPSADIDKFVVTDTTTSTIVGFTATSDISARSTALVASIFTPETKIASIWGIHQTLLVKYRAGFQFANLGGTETEGSYTFLRRTFRPIEELEKTHLVYS